MLHELETRLAEREALLGRVQEMLERDARVRAAWMYGSVGRGCEDAWSDLDVWVVLEDAEYSALARERRRFVRETGDPLLFVEAPQNGPPGGIYLMCVYDAPTGPHAVDWYFQPASCARQTESRRVLVQRGEALSTEAPVGVGAEQWVPSPEEDDANKAALFWVMLLVQAKCIARDPRAPGLRFEGFILSLLRDVAAFRGKAIKAREAPNVLEPEQKLNRLRRHASAMADIAPEHAAPHAGTLRLLDLVRRACVWATAGPPSPSPPLPSH
jgi:hypothetical protein